MKIPEAYDPLVQLLADAADGAHQHGAAVGLKQNTEAALRADLVALVGQPADPGGEAPAVPGLKALWNDAKANKSAQTAALRTAQSNARALAMTCINTLKPVLGAHWGGAWNAAGFTSSSLAVPTNPLVLLQQLRAYYAKNPAREVPNVNGIACTAAACGAAAQGIGAAQTASNQSNTDAGNAQVNLQNGIAAGRARMSGLFAELGQLLEDTDPRWLAFGFDLPGSTSTPDIPENVTATPGAAGSGTLFLHADDARRATGYRFVLTDAAGKEVAEQLTQDPEASFASLATGAALTVTATARNATGESKASAPVSATVP